MIADEKHLIVSISEYKGDSKIDVIDAKSFNIVHIVEHELVKRSSHRLGHEKNDWD